MSGKGKRVAAIQLCSGGIYADNVLDVFKKLIRPCNLIFFDAVHKKVNKNMSGFLETIKF